MRAALGALFILIGIVLGCTGTLAWFYVLQRFDIDQVQLETTLVGDSRVIEAKRAIDALLHDPFSARYYEVTVVQFETRTYVCGTVNSKNAFGAYVGRRPFIHLVGSGPLWIANNTDESNVTHLRVCVSGQPP
jgi:hypothetical protein